ncbi:MAG: putative antitoxin component YuzE of a toxin-antitoxin system [Thermodesulfobacterium sp.]|uniref:Antitoxin component YuzE of a toxin-antitoxin system n=1 Tax=Candidatus Thermodesulfobacterium syntrophicum TaxID=3060442 RepID=A0AAE3P5J6_9BACT|nr:putative antitoxin component YuzE of a toxin-antitoxin system [Candidatus Thermodesulfobacterium syntrophicum]
MAETILSREMINEIFKVTHCLLKFPQKKMWIDYDEEADVLYISFRRPQKATDTKMTKEGILLRFKNNELVGITILDASKR